MPDEFPPLTAAEEALLQRHFKSVTYIQHLGASLGERRRGSVEIPVARYLYVVEVYSESKRTEEQHGFTFYYSDFRTELGAVHRELHFSRAGTDFLALYDLSHPGKKA